jgi:hypothetical protein
MKKRIIIGVIVATSSILGLIARDPLRAPLPENYYPVKINIPLKVWQDPIPSTEQGRSNEKEFNEVRTVCIPASVARTGAAEAMKKIGAHKTFQTPDGKNYCYVKFFFNPTKKPQARMLCGGRTRQVEYGHAFSTINQIPCWVNYLNYSDNIKNKVENPLDYAHYAQTISQAVEYLKTGLIAVSQ